MRNHIRKNQNQMMTFMVLIINPLNKNLQSFKNIISLVNDYSNLLFLFFEKQLENDIPDL